MLEYIYDMLIKYLHDIETVGYVSITETKNMLFIIYVNDLIENDAIDYLTESDYNSINKALYKIYGYSNLVPYADFMSQKYNKDTLITSTPSISSVITRINTIEQSIENVITGDDDVVSDIDDVVVT